MSSVSEHREIEFKFRVPADVTLDVEALLHQASIRFAREPLRSMSATYYDTSNLNLLRWGITLRHRTGGADDGWHMKIPAAPSADTTSRDEVRVDGSAHMVPSELASIASPLIRRQEIVPMAHVDTQRMPFVISDESGAELVEVVDDEVSVRIPGSPDATAFREVEVELLTDAKNGWRIASAVSQALRESGAKPSSVSKAAQALGRRAGDPPDVPALDYPKPDAPAIDALQAIFSRYVRELLMADVGVRRQLPDAVHQMRVACRRLRAALATFRPLLDPDAAAFLREELAWLATELGQVRDTEVQLEALNTGITDDASREFVVTYLQQRLRAARSSALAALRSDRHDFLIEDLVLLVGEPPVGPRAFEPVDTAIRECVETPWRSLKRGVTRAGVDSPAEDWHRVRIKAKKARYAVEAVAPVFGREYGQLGKSLAWATDILGSRQDAQVAIHTLEQIAASAPPSIAFTLGVHAARCESSGNDDVRAFVKRWPNIARQARELGLQ